MMVSAGHYPTAQGVEACANATQEDRGSLIEAIVGRLDTLTTADLVGLVSVVGCLATAPTQ
jgi:hypothetical protein